MHAKAERILFNRYDSSYAEPLQLLVQAEAFYLLHGHFLDKLASGGNDFETSGQDNLNGLAAAFAASAYAKLSGKPLNWPPAVDPTHGELREVQRQSRISSGGTATISMELALLVAKGEMSMEEALRATIDK